MPTPMFSRRRALASFALALLALVGCGKDDAAPPAPAAAPQPVAPPNAVELVFPYGSEKKAWLEEATAAFHASNPTLPDGRPVFVRTRATGSGETVEDVLSGRVQAHLASPASGVFVEQGNAQSRAAGQGDLFEPGRNLVLSPVVIAMWKPMAEALGYPGKPIGWADVAALAASGEGWAAHGHPEWGAFRFGHTHPLYSNSGLISVLAETYAGAGKVRGLTVADVQDANVGTFVEGVERAVVHYGRSTGFFADGMFDRGPGYLSAAVLYESDVVRSYDKAGLPFPVVAVYPREGTFMSDHPACVVRRPWVSDEHRAAAKLYVDFLMSRPQQELALALGFRPGSADVPFGAPLDAAHGVDAQQPATTLEVPSADVVAAALDVWKTRKKPSRIVVVFDKSGSMKKDSRMDAAKRGAAELVKLLNDADAVSLLAFDGRAGTPAAAVTLGGGGRERVQAQIGGLFANGGTALFDAVASAEASAKAGATGDAIAALVVLSDGEDTDSKTKLDDLLARLAPDPERPGVRVFAIAYGDDAGPAADGLRRMAETTGGKFYKGGTGDIVDVFRDISTFF